MSVWAMLLSLVEISTLVVDAQQHLHRMVLHFVALFCARGVAVVAVLLDLIANSRKRNLHTEKK